MKKSQLRKLIRKIIAEQSQLGDTPPYDGIVNNSDLQYVMQNWLQPGDAYDSTDGIVNTDDLSLVNINWLQGQTTGNSSPPTSGCESCDTSVWDTSGFTNTHSSWVEDFTAMPHFSSSNPNQPCKMLCQKIQNWTNKCSNIEGPLRQNLLACKIEEAQNQSQIHGCNC